MLSVCYVNSSPTLPNPPPPGMEDVHGARGCAQGSVRCLARERTWGPYWTHSEKLGNPRRNGRGLPRPRPHVSGYFECATNSFQIQFSSTRIRRIRQRIRLLFSIRSPEWTKKKSDNVWTANPDIFESHDIAKSCPVSCRTITQYGGTACTPSFPGVNPICVWKGEFDFNSYVWTGKNIWVRVDGA